MTVETKVKSGGSWRTITEPKVKYSGSWRDVQQIEVKSGGSWRTVFEIGGTVPLVSNIEIWHTGGSGQTRTGIIFHDDRSGVGSDDGRIITKKHWAASIEVITDMGNDDQSSPVDHTGEWTADTVTESEWEVACVSVDFGGYSLEHAAVGVYTALNTVDMLWQRTRTGGKSRTPGTSVVDGTFRIREIADTANYTEFTVKLTAVQT